MRERFLRRDESCLAGKNGTVSTYRRYVAIGDSSTEGLEDPWPDGSYRGWADRLAQHIADAQPEPVEYANLAIRGLRLHEIREGQFDQALAVRPDLLTIFGGVNDVIGVRCDFGQMRDDLDEMFATAREQDVTVATFTMPDPAAINPLARSLRARMSRLNDEIRGAAEAYGVLLVDFEQFPIAADPRLWFEDRLHGNPLGHQRVAAALAWRLGVPGFDESWADALPEEAPVVRVREHVSGDIDWAVRYLAPWVARGVRRLPHGLGISPKRPVPTLVPPSDAADDVASA